MVRVVVLKDTKGEYEAWSRQHMGSRPVKVGSRVYLPHSRASVAKQPNNTSHACLPRSAGGSENSWMLLDSFCVSFGGANWSVDAAAPLAGRLLPGRPSALSWREMTFISTAAILLSTLPGWCIHDESKRINFFLSSWACPIPEPWQIVTRLSSLKAVDVLHAQTGPAGRAPLWPYILLHFSSPKSRSYRLPSTTCIVRCGMRSRCAHRRRLQSSPSNDHCQSGRRHCS